MAILLLASLNKGKLVEMQAILSGLPVELILPSRQESTWMLIEDGRTYAENASRKARAFCQPADWSPWQMILG